MAIRLTKWRIFALVLVILLLIDRLSKAWVLNNLELYESVPILPPFIQITRSFNTGAAFGIGDGASGVFLILALAITGAIVYYFRSVPADAYRQHVALSLIVGGAFSNILDRVQYGQVIDFVHLSLPGVISNVSNFADHAIVLGVALLLLDSFLQKPAQPVLDETPVETPKRSDQDA